MQTENVTLPKPTRNEFPAEPAGFVAENVAAAAATATFSSKSFMASVEDEWVECEKCFKWRRLPNHISADSIPDVWECSMNTWNAKYSICNSPEEVVKNLEDPCLQCAAIASGKASKKVHHVSCAKSAANRRKSKSGPPPVPPLGISSPVAAQELCQLENLGQSSGKEVPVKIVAKTKDVPVKFVVKIPAVASQPPVKSPTKSTVNNVTTLKVHAEGTEKISVPLVVPASTTETAADAEGGDVNPVVAQIAALRASMVASRSATQDANNRQATITNAASAGVKRKAADRVPPHDDYACFTLSEFPRDQLSQLQFVLVPAGGKKSAATKKARRNSRQSASSSAAVGPLFGESVTLGGEMLMYKLPASSLSIREVDPERDAVCQGGKLSVMHRPGKDGGWLNHMHDDSSDDDSDDDNNEAVDMRHCPTEDGTYAFRSILQHNVEPDAAVCKGLCAIALVPPDHAKSASTVRNFLEEVSANHPNSQWVQSWFRTPKPEVGSASEGSSERAWFLTDLLKIVAETQSSVDFESSTRVLQGTFVRGQFAIDQLDCLEKNLTKST
jgi:hypothetical protein